MSIEPEAVEEAQDDLFTEERSPNFTDPIDVLAEDAPDIEVSVIDDTPEEDRNRPPRGDVPEDVDEDIPGLSERVKSRMDTLRYEFHNERRDKETALRENNEAVRYAQNVQTENKALKDQLSNSRRLLYDQVSARTMSSLTLPSRGSRKPMKPVMPTLLLMRSRRCRAYMRNAHIIMWQRPMPIMNSQYSRRFWISHSSNSMCRLRTRRRLLGCRKTPGFKDPVTSS